MSGDVISQVIDARSRDVGGFAVRRLLPHAARRLVGPFAFFDHMGPAALSPGQGMDVPPHPHIGLATVTYLFEGEVVHRDSLGSKQTIRPGEINWMVAGRGIAHSERTGAELRARGSRVHGLQLWVALPAADEEIEPQFHHHDAASLPQLERAGVKLRLLVGRAYGERSPVHSFSPTFYVDAAMPAGARLEVPDYDERAAYVVEGEVELDDGQRAGPGRMLVFAPGTDTSLRAISPTRLVLLGGAAIDGPRHIWWNFVSSRRERIEQAKRDWREGRFAKIPGDEHELVPLPK